MSRMIWQLGLVCWFVQCSFSTDLKALDDGVLFAVKWPGSLTDDVLKDLEPGSELMDMNSADGEKFKCVIPPMNAPTEQEKQDYTGPNALELLEPLIQQTSCSFRLESYWTYEVCHGKYVRQYHQEMGRSPKLQEYYLGKWEADRFKREAAKLNERIAEKRVGPLPTKKIDGLNMPYVELNMTDGTMCDLSGMPRSVRVLYICYRQGKHEVYSFEEVKTCEYEVIILSPLLCAHPDYRVRDQLHNDINCYAAESTNRRPKTLREMEAESLKLRHQTTILELTTGPGRRYTVEINPVDIQEVLDQADVPAKPAVAGYERVDAEEPRFSKKRVERPEGQPSYDAKLVEDFLAGTYCLHGGTGWWKYEFCYGKKVLQYHVDADGTKTTVLLGLFDKQAHLEWLEKHPSKKPAPGPKKTLSHFYSGGSTCDMTGKPRQVEVRLKCRESGTSESLNAVSLYLLEPDVCSYVLGVESPILCHLMDSADENGLISAPIAAPKLEALSGASVVTAALKPDGAESSVVTVDGAKGDTGAEPVQVEESQSPEVAESQSPEVSEPPSPLPVAKDEDQPAEQKEPHTDL